MDRGGYGSGGVLLAHPRSPAGSSKASGSPVCGMKPDPARPARNRVSSFGDDAELSGETPQDWTLAKFQKKVKAALTEYFLSRAVDDAASHIQDIMAKCPSEADELGVLAVRHALDKGGDADAQTAVVALLCALSKLSVVSHSALIRSFEKLFCSWEDITIDVPQAPEALLGILHGCVEGGVVDRLLLSKLPENLLKAGLARATPEFQGMLSTVAAELKEFKRKASQVLEEFFVVSNADEVATFLTELNQHAYHHEFVKKAITLSFSQSDVTAARESVLLLFVQLTRKEVLTKDDLQWGVARLLSQLDDLTLDCPHCGELATELCAGLVCEELVSVPFLRRMRLLRIGGAAGLRVLDDTRRKTPEYTKKYFSPEQFKREIQAMILEYFNSEDKDEFGRCFRELAPLTPEQMSELIRKIMILAMERSGLECEMALKLIVWLSRHEEIDEDGMAAGFDDMYTKMPDFILDVPDAEEMARSFVVEAKKAKVLRDCWPEPPEP